MVFEVAARTQVVDPIGKIGPFRKERLYLRFAPHGIAAHKIEILLARDGCSIQPKRGNWNALSPFLLEEWQILPCRNHNQLALFDTAVGSDGGARFVRPRAAVRSRRRVMRPSTSCRREAR